MSSKKSSKKSNFFSNSLKKMSSRDVAVLLKSLQTNLSELTPHIETDKTTMSVVSSQLEDAKRTVTRLEAELNAIQAKNRTNNDVHKTLTSQIDQTKKHLETVEKVSEKDVYVNRCIEYLVDNRYEDVYKCENTYLPVEYRNNFIGKFTKENLQTNLTDNTIIKIAHLVHMLELYDEFECDYKKIYYYMWMDTYTVLFSKPTKYSRHKTEAYLLADLDKIIAYNKGFSLDTTIEEVQNTRID